MATATQDRTTAHLDVRRPGSWRHEVLDRVGRMETELATTTGLDPAIADDLDQAREIAADRHGVNPWSGRDIENAWRHLRLAEEGLLATRKDHADIVVAARKALGHAQGHLPPDFALTQDLQKALSAQTPEDPTIHELAEAVTVAAHEACTTEHHKQRSFRNQIRGLTLVLVILAAATVAVIFVLPAESTAGLLPAPKSMTTEIAVPLAMFLGSLGALFSALPSLSQLASQSSPFNPVKEQAALKVVVGAWSAVVGLLVVQAGMSGAGTATTTSPATAGTVAGFAVMAALFGASQEAITRFADHKAGQVAPSST